MNCTHCGANLTADDMRLTTCRYCGTVLAHHARAMEKVAVVQGLMGDANGNGIPDALEGMIPPGMMPPRPYGAFGAGVPPGAGGPVVIVGSAVVMSGGAAPPLAGGPVVFHGNPAYQAAEHARRGMRTMMIVIVVLAVVLPLLIGGIVVAVTLFAR